MLRPEYLLAGAALAAALAMGTAQAAHASQSSVDSPAYAAALDELRGMHQSCAGMGGTMVYDDGHLVEVTFTDDGVADFVLIAEKAYCDGAASLFCGSGGCAVTAFASSKGGVVVGPYTLHNPQPEDAALTHTCRNGGEGALTFADGDFRLTGC
jgi:hypothetical protein